MPSASFVKIIEYCRAARVLRSSTPNFYIDYKYCRNFLFSFVNNKTKEKLIFGMSVLVVVELEYIMFLGLFGTLCARRVIIISLRIICIFTQFCQLSHENKQSHVMKQKKNGQTIILHFYFCFIKCKLQPQIFCHPVQFTYACHINVLLTARQKRKQQKKTLFFCFLLISKLTKFKQKRKQPTDQEAMKKKKNMVKIEITNRNINHCCCEKKNYILFVVVVGVVVVHKMYFCHFFLCYFGLFASFWI